MSIPADTQHENPPHAVAFQRQFGPIVARVGPRLSAFGLERKGGYGAQVLSLRSRVRARRLRSGRLDPGIVSAAYAMLV